MKKPIYLDYQATTPADPRVVEAMNPYWFDMPGNPHSRTHKFGWDAEEATEKARKQIADVIGADPKEIVFTSGATESNNMALKGAAEFYGSKGKHIITVVTEHKCVLDSCRHLVEQGFEITYLPVQSSGLIDLDVLKAAIRPDTIIMSVMHANNEIGVIQDIGAIGAICKEAGVKFHSDCAQSFGKIPIDVNEMNIDCMSISSHKVYGPMGMGALYVSRKPRMRVRPIIHGGGQERGMRSGTLPTPLIVGFGKAAELAQAEMTAENKRLTVLRDKMIDTIQAAIPEVYLNGDREQRLAGNLNLSFAYVEGESLMLAISDLAVSSGSACTSASLEPSYVLRALGLSDDMAHTSIRIGLGRFTTEEEVDYALETILAQVQKLRDMSPLWEMVQEGIDISKIKWAEH
ncbi:MAG: cysteine desulfurase [Alphaproteobacteria bacterium]|jgi:cysteine desulfurase